MIVKRTSRDEILSKLRKKMSENKPLFFASASNGLVAKCLEMAGVDCINTFSGGRLRANGMGSMAMMWPILDSNAQTLDYTEHDILPAIKGDTFICACINPNDPLRDMRLLLQKYIDMGVFAVANSGPSISYFDKDSQIFKVLTQSGITFENEIEMLKLAKEMGMVSIAMPFDYEDSIKMVTEAMPDIYCFHAGTSRGGLIGYDSKQSIEEIAEITEKIIVDIKRIKKDLIVLVHGAALVTPEDGQYILDHTSADGVWTGSATERIPIENAVLDVAKKFANLEMPRR